MLKKILKITALVAAVILLLFVIAVLVIRIPSVQQYVVNKITNAVSSKTHSNISIGRVGIQFPKSIHLEKIYLDDRQRDTLLFAGELNLDLDMIALIKGDVEINKAALDDVVLNLRRAENDSTFNFSFILDSFGKDSTKKSADTSASGFSISKIALNRIRILYDDNYNGLNVNGSFQKLEIKSDSLDLKNLRFFLDDILFAEAKVEMTITKKDTAVNNSPSGPLPFFTARKLDLTKIEFQYNDLVDSQNIALKSGEFIFKGCNIDLALNHYHVNQLESDQTSFLMQSRKNKSPLQDTVVARLTQPVLVSVDEIKVTDNSIGFDDLAAIKKIKGFDEKHFHIGGLNLEASQTRYAAEETRAVMQAFSFYDDGGFVLKKMEGEVSYAATGIVLKKLIAKTKHSEINCDVKCSYTSVEALRDSLQNVVVDASLSKTKIDPQDIIYFVPAIEGKPFFSRNSSVIAIEGKIKGEIKNLVSSRIVVQAGKSTRLETSFHITGLPDAEHAFFYVPTYHLITTAADIRENFPDSLIPAALEVPAQLAMEGNFNGTLQQFNTDVALESSFGKLHASLRMQEHEKFDLTASADNFNAGMLLKKTELLGGMTLNTHIMGSGFKKETLDATIALHVSSMVINSYTYRDLQVDGKVSDQVFNGKMDLNDSNIAFSYNGLIGFKKGEEAYKFELNLKGANLQKLNLTKDDFRIAALFEADLKGSDYNNFNGTAGITKIVLVKGEKTYTLDSLLFASVNETGRSEMSVSSALIDIKFKGNIAPGLLAKEMRNHLSHYFTLSDSIPLADAKNNFAFEIHLHNHPVISEVFFPSLTAFEPGTIEGSFDGEKQILDVKAGIFKLEYAGILVQDFGLTIKSDPSKLSYSVFTNEISNSLMMFEKLQVNGDVSHNQSTMTCEVGKDEKARRLALKAEINSPHKGSTRIHFAPDFTLGGTAWKIPGDNELIFAKSNLSVIHFALTNDRESINVNSKDSALEINFKDFELDHVSRIIQKDTSLAQGRLNGKFTMFNGGSFSANATLNNLVIRSHPAGDLHISSKKSTAGVFDINVGLTGNDNDLNITGTISPKQSEDAMHLTVDIQSLSMGSVEGFSFGQLQNSSGKITGNLNCSGSFSKPKLNGEIHFLDVSTRPTAINSQLKLENEKITATESGLTFSSFTIRDKEDHTARISGTINTSDWANPVFNLNAVTDHFLAVNSSAKTNDVYYGTLIIDSRIDIKGTPSFPKINADIKLDDGSNFTFAVPETKLTEDKGEGVVVFTNNAVNPILETKRKAPEEKSGFKNIDLVSDIRVDKAATLKLLIDPTTGDSLVVKGEAALSFALDPSGKISLTGRYALYEGSYLVSLEDLVKKKFEIEKGGTIIWNGDPLDADIDVRAHYTVRTAPGDLVASQMGTLTAAEQNMYKERLTFEVILKLKGQLLKPDISFEIQLAPEDRGALGGAVNAKLSLLNADESELNKQVFALLVLDRFIQEDPLASSGGGGAEGVARQSVSRFLSQQLNKLSQQYISGVELNLDVQSYDDYSSGTSKGRTEVGIGVKKQFNPRFSVQVGGSVDVEGEKTKQNNASELTGDILVEYKLTQDGRYRLKGFRQSEYEGLIEGQVIKTGAGILYTRDFDRWKELFGKAEDKSK